MTVMRRRIGRRRVLGIGAVALAVPGLLRAAPAATEWIGGDAFATTWSVTVPAGRALDRMRPDLETVLSEVDRQMSPWRPDSEISRVNRGRAGHHAVSAATRAVCGAALRIAEASGGCFDPTVGPLVARWGFGPIEGDVAGDWRGLDVTRAGIGKADDRMTVDLCGIAKGWALDRMAARLRAAGHGEALLELGGEFHAIGRHPSGRSWRVGVADPGGQGGVLARIGLRDMAVATSGLTWQSYTVGRRTYGHIVDPRTDEPAAGALRAVSVAHPEAMLADAWSTALFVAGADSGPALAARHAISALFVVDADGMRTVATTGRMAEMML